MTTSSFRAKNPTRVFVILIVAQFCGTSLWFAGNAALPQLQQQYGWPSQALGWLTGCVQFGFITGTLLFSILGLADKVSPSRLFFACSVAGALTNVVVLAQPSSYTLTLISRGATGFFLAGIYPVGMKIAADWQEHGLGHWLGALVGALVLGTAFPHGLKLLPNFVNVSNLLLGVSMLSVAGGIVMALFVPDGPFRKKSSTFSFNAVRDAFRSPAFRSSAFGYFGHMWELYAFWAFAPWIINVYKQHHSLDYSTSLLSFAVIGIGAAGCVMGGRLSFTIGSNKVAFYALLCSGLCCIASPLIWWLPLPAFLFFLMIWGFSVVADSPQFSTVIARSAPPEIRGSALTIVTCIGFAITIVSIQLLNSMADLMDKPYVLLLLAPGPALGLISMKRITFARA